MYKTFQDSITLDMDDSDKDKMALKAIGNSQFNKSASRSMICLIDDIAPELMGIRPVLGL